MKPVNLAKSLALLNRNPNDETNISSYIRELRSSLADLLMENSILRDEASLPFISKISKSFRYNPLPPNHYYFQKGLDDYLFLTITFDPRKFPQLIITSQEEQKQYIEQVLTKANQQEIITLFYGVYELQKNGNIHIHIILNKYNSKENIETIKSFFTPFFTARKDNKYCIDVKPVTNMDGLINDYLIKAPEGVVHNLSDNYEVIYDLNL